MSTVTGRAPSPALQTFQEISGETRLLQAQGFQRSSPYPHLPGPHIPRPAPASAAKREGTGRRGWTLRGSEKPAPGKTQRAEMLAARRLPPQAPCGESHPVQRPPTGATPSPIQPLQPPVANSAGGAVGGRWLYFPQSLTFANKVPSPSSKGRGRPKRPGRSRTPAGHAAETHLPARGPGSRAGAQRSRTVCPAPRLFPEQERLIIGGARPPGSRRASLLCAGQLGLRFSPRPPPGPRQQQARL